MMPEPFTLVIFGASGDLTRRKLLPAFFRLHCQGLLPAGTSILGFARSEKTDESFRDELRRSTGQALICDGEPLDDAGWADFASRLYYQRGAYDSADDFDALGRRLEALSGQGGNRLWY